MVIHTTLNKIRDWGPCQPGWQTLLKYLNKTKADDEKLLFSTILKSNNIQDALWSLRSVSPEHDKKIRLLACDYAERVLHFYEKEYPNDNRPRKAIEAGRKLANGEINAASYEAACAACAAACAACAAYATAYAAAYASYAAACAACAAYATAYAAAEKEIQAELLIKYFG